MSPATPTPNSIIDAGSGTRVAVAMTEAEYVVSIPPWVTKVKIAFAESYPVALKTPVPTIINVGRLEPVPVARRLSFI
jgi:hypothetical protein